VSLQHPEVIRLDLPARYTYLHILSDCIADMLRQIDGVEDHEMLTYNMQLAAHEACTNIVGHAYDGANNGSDRIIISLSLFPQPRRLEIELHDTGKAFDPDRVPSPSLEQAQVHGYGLFLMRNLMDKVTYKAQAGDNYWCLVKNL
jgi:serine/threonine-protein kinase RsbW